MQGMGRGTAHLVTYIDGPASVGTPMQPVASQTGGRGGLFFPVLSVMMISLFFFVVNAF
jgi:hypothetical protein